MLKDIPAPARPREKLLAQGPAALADAELIALLLRTGIKGTSVLQLAQRLLDAFGGLAGLLRAGPDELKRVKGGMNVTLSLTRDASDQRRLRVLDEHDRIVHAIRVGDADSAAIAMRYHLDQARNRLLDRHLDR